MVRGPCVQGLRKLSISAGWWVGGRMVRGLCVQGLLSGEAAGRCQGAAPPFPHCVRIPGWVLPLKHGPPSLRSKLTVLKGQTWGDRKQRLERGVQMWWFPNEMCVN